MIKSKWITAITAITMVIVLSFTVFGLANPKAVQNILAGKVSGYVTEMDKTQILTVEITADPTAWEAMIAKVSKMGPEQVKEYIPVDVTINGVNIKNAAIRPKGSSSLGITVSAKNERFSFLIEFDHYIKGQTWLGLDKLCLNNMALDPSGMKEFLSYDILSYIGVVTPLFAYSDLSLNGETYGFYLAVEAVENGFLKRNFDDPLAQLYKPDKLDNGIPQNNAAPVQGTADGEPQPNQGEPQKIDGGKSGADSARALTYTDNDSSNYATIFENAIFKPKEADFQRVMTALESLNAGTNLETYIDVDAVLRYFAAHTTVVNIDSYISGILHNYYLYESKGQLTILPWDYNEAFGNFGGYSAERMVNFPIDTPVDVDIELASRPLLAKLLEVPKYAETYHNYLREIVDGYFNSGIFSKTLADALTLTDDYAKADPRPFFSYEKQREAVSMLKELILLRAKSIEGQLNGQIPATYNDQKENPELLLDTSAIDMSLVSGGGGTVINKNDGVTSAEGGQKPGSEPITNSEPQPGGASKFMLEGVELTLLESDIKDFKVWAQAIKIVKAAENGVLSMEQSSELAELGFSEEQIERVRLAVEKAGSSENNKPN